MMALPSGNGENFIQILPLRLLSLKFPGAQATPRWLQAVKVPGDQYRYLMGRPLTSNRSLRRNDRRVDSQIAYVEDRFRKLLELPAHSR